MSTQPNPSGPATPDDAEFEWLLCLASAMQTRERAAKTGPESQGPAEPKLRSKLQSFLKGLRGGQRIGLA